MMNDDLTLFDPLIDCSLIRSDELKDLINLSLMNRFERQVCLSSDQFSEAMEIRYKIDLLYIDLINLFIDLLIYRLLDD